MENSSSPHKARNYQGIVNAVLIYLRNERTTSQVAVLVEGPDDEKAYRKFFNQNMAQLFVCIGKDSLQKYLQELLLKTKHAIGIRDADFLNLANDNPKIPHLFFTDGHDIEMTMLSFAEVRRNLFSEYGQSANIDPAWESIVKEASFVGYIRWFNEMNDYKITFDGLFYKASGDGDREQSLLNQLNDQSPDKKGMITKELIHDFSTEHNTDDTFNLCNGHDVVALLVRAFKMSEKQLATALRLSFQERQFIQTRLYAKLLSWQSAHGFDLLKTDLGEPNA